MVFCSSINDKDIRDECLKTWKKYGNSTELDEENQNYYFYYAEIYINVYKENEELNKKFNGIFKYINYFNQGLQKEEIMEKITKDIIDKIKEFSDKQKYSLDFILTNIRNMINKKYEINKLISI